MNMGFLRILNNGNKLDGSDIFVLLLFLLFAMFMNINFGIFRYHRYIPQESELKYSEGILRKRLQKQAIGKSSSIYYYQIYDSDTKKYLDFSCDYTAVSRGSNSNCYLPKEYENTQVKVGWYQQPDFLMHSNDKLQIVILEKDGKQIRSYNHWLNDIRANNIINIIVVVFFNSVCVLGFYLAVPRYNRKFKNKM